MSHSPEVRIAAVTISRLRLRLLAGSECGYIRDFRVADGGKILYACC